MATGLLDYIGEQSNLSGLQSWAAQQAQAGTLDPSLAALAQAAPRAFAEIAPAVIQRQQQMSLLGLNNQSGNQSAIQQYGNSGDQNPNYAAPQSLPDQPTQSQQPSGLDQVRQAFAYGGGDLEKGFKALQAQKALIVPPGTGTIPQGQQYQNGKLVNLPGAMTPGQQDRDKDFADIYTPFKNTGGEANAKSQIEGIQGVIDDLASGKITTGDVAARYALDNEGMPSEVGRLADPSLIYASNQVAKAVLPSSKALFGARVTQGEVFRNLMANGLNPYATNEENIKNLTTLKNNLSTAQKNLAKAGEYFDKNGTLAGYNSAVPGIDAGGTSLNPGGATNQPNPALIQALKKRGLLK